jgi:hypothetical protein
MLQKQSATWSTVSLCMSESCTGRRRCSTQVTIRVPALAKDLWLSSRSIHDRAGAHVRVIGKGRKERCTPLAKPTVAVLNAWLREAQRGDGRVLFPNAKGERPRVHGVQYMLNKHSTSAARECPLLKGKRVTVHLLRHTMATKLLQAGVDRAVIALWLGHESVDTTQIYLEATLAMKEQALAKTSPPHGTPARYRPGDQLLSFLNNLLASRKLCRVIGRASTRGDLLITLNFPQPGRSPDIVGKGR